jgi:2-(1,2-epoxy-1,2-dihydrophenyl)acetyl-CoA isomerase
LITVRLDRPEVFNALNGALLDDLVKAARCIGQDADIRGVVLTASGKAFCAGADLSPGAFLEVAGETRGATTRRLLNEHFNPAVLAWAELPQPLVVAVNGVAAGGGVGLALLGDVILAARGASFQNPFVPRLALVPDLAAGWHMQHLLGAGRALALCLLGEPLEASRAAEWGLIWECVDDGLLDARAMDLAGRLASGPILATRRTKSLLRGDLRAELAARLALEADLQGELADHPDHAEGVRAFLEKRRPRFA